MAPTGTTSKSNSVIAAAIEMVEDSRLVALDLETTGLDPRTSEIRLVQVSNGDETYVIDTRSADVTPVIEAIASEAKTVIAHGATLEWAHLYHHYGLELEDVRDTMLLAQLVAAGDMSTERGLGPITDDLLGIELDKDTQTSDWSLEKLTKRQLDYAALDAQVLLPLYAKLAGEIARLGLERVAEIENAAIPAVARMKLEGMPVDKAAWDEHAAEVEAELKALERRMLEADWMPRRDPVPQTWTLQGPDCKEMLEKTLGTEVPGTTRKDLDPLAGDHVIVEKLLAYRKAKGDEREDLKAIVLEHAAEKPPIPAPPWNFGSHVQVNEIVNEILGYYLESTDEATLLRYVDEHPLFGMLLEYRGLSKRLGTYGTGWFKDAYQNGRVYPGWWQIGTSTGRFACSAPNAQNLPGDYRRFFVAPKGRMFVGVDYSQIEVRICAKMLNVTALLEMYENDKDVYKATAANMLGIDEDDVTKEQRQLAKAILLGMMYGLSRFGLPVYAYKNYGVKMTPALAEEHVRSYYDLYPEIEEYHDSVLEELEENGHVDQKTMSGRRRDGITNRNEAINAPVQGTAADGLKMAMALVHERLRKLEGTAFIVASIHDELLIECDGGDGEEILEIVSEAMVEAMDALVNADGPRVPIKVGGRVTRAWTKE